MHCLPFLLKVQWKITNDHVIMKNNQWSFTYVYKGIESSIFYFIHAYHCNLKNNIFDKDMHVCTGDGWKGCILERRAPVKGRVFLQPGQVLLLVSYMQLLLSKIFILVDHFYNIVRGDKEEIWLSWGIIISRIWQKRTRCAGFHILWRNWAVL